MRAIRLFPFNALLSLLLGIGTLPCSAAQPAPVAELALQARLFYSQSASFSADVLAPGGPELGNVVARDDASTSSLVVLAVTLADGKVVPSDSRIHFTARQAPKKGVRSRTLLDQVVPIGAVNKGGITHIGFWLPDTGCHPIELRASLTVARQPISVSTQALIPFGCNE